MAEPVTEFHDRLSLEFRYNMGWDWASDVCSYRLSQFLIKGIAAAAS